MTLCTKAAMALVFTYRASPTFLAVFFAFAVYAHVPDSFSWLMDGHPAPNTTVSDAYWCSLSFGMQHNICLIVRLHASCMNQVLDLWLRQEQSFFNLGRL
jgi:hypothetical protein